MLRCRQQQNRRLRTQMERASFVGSLGRRERQQDEGSNLKVGKIAALRFSIFLIGWSTDPCCALQRPAALTCGSFNCGDVVRPRTSAAKWLGAQVQSYARLSSSISYHVWHTRTLLAPGGKRNLQPDRLPRRYSLQIVSGGFHAKD